MNPSPLRGSLASLGAGYRQAVRRTRSMDIYAKAVENVWSALVSGRIFPNQVFTLGWRHYRFFDADLMLDRDFIGLTNQLLELEGAKCACMVNVDTGTNAEVLPSTIQLDQRSPTETFAAVTQGPINWLTCMVNLGASSDLGGWCAYCEPMAEIAVIAFRSSELYERAGNILAGLQAGTVKQQLAEPKIYVFMHAAMNPGYFEQLAAEYSEVAETEQGA